MNRYRNDLSYPCNSNADTNMGTGNCGGCHNNNSNGNSMTAAQSQLLNKLRKIDFAIYDTILYLDAYPHCKAALEYYKKLVAESNAITEQLAKSGMPMTAMGNRGDTWNWINSPWPWEYEANV